MPPASPAIARARRAPNPLHLLLTVIGRHDLQLLFARPQLFRAMLLLLQCNPRTLLIEERAGIASGSYVQARGVLWSCKKKCQSVAR